MFFSIYFIYMEIVINWWAIIVCAVASMVLGSIWYGPLFGKTWLRIIGASEMDIEKRKEMQKKAMPLYFIQIILSIFQVWVLAYYIAGWVEASALTNALWIWAGFVMPTVAATAMWNNNPRKIAWAQFLVQAGYQLVAFIMFALILGAWM